MQSRGVSFREKFPFVFNNGLEENLHGKHLDQTLDIMVQVDLPITSLSTGICSQISSKAL